MENRRLVTPETAISVIAGSVLSNSWKVYRIPEFLIKKEFEKVEQELLSYLRTFDDQPKLFTFSSKIIEHEEFKKYKIEKQQQQRDKANNERSIIKQQLVNKRLEDVKQVGQYWGFVTELSDLWSVYHTQVRRFLRKYGSNLVSIVNYE